MAARSGVIGAFLNVKINAAGLEMCIRDRGSIAVGKKANFYITTPITGIEYLPYAYGTDLVEAVFLNGEQI